MENQALLDRLANLEKRVDLQRQAIAKYHGAVTHFDIGLNAYK